MNRRSFLRISGLFAFALVVLPERAATMGAEVATGQTVYRGDSAGNILVSRDAGNTWQVHSRFGSRCPVLGMYQDAAQHVYARLGFNGSSFDLVLVEGDRWKTV